MMVPRSFEFELGQETRASEFAIRRRKFLW
jgi:hypothetical protein